MSLAAKKKDAISRGRGAVLLGAAATYFYSPCTWLLWYRMSHTIIFVSPGNGRMYERESLICALLVGALGRRVVLLFIHADSTSSASTSFATFVT